MLFAGDVAKNVFAMFQVRRIPCQVSYHVFPCRPCFSSASTVLLMTGQQTATGNECTISDSLIDASFFKVISRCSRVFV